MADDGAGRSRRARTTTADGGGGGSGRCLSDLTDDLLRHILFLAPDREGASTAVLSRRWRWLWRTSGAVFIDSRSFRPSRSKERSASFAGDHRAEAALAAQEREAFFRGAEETLAAAAAALGFGPIRRLTFFVAAHSKILLRWCSVPYDRRTEQNMMEALVSNPAARRVEELHIVVRASNTRFALSFGSLPSQALRVLRITHCDTLTAGGAAGAGALFPMLVDLHLKSCSVSLADLQRIMDAAPLLSKLHLAGCHLSAETSSSSSDAPPMSVLGTRVMLGRLRIPAVSALVIANCRYGYERLELDVPRLQSFCFRYKGPVNQAKHRLSLKSQAAAPTGIDHVDLRFTRDDDFSGRASNKGQNRQVFWRFLQNFSTVKVLKIKIEFFTMAGLACVDKASRDELLGGFSFTHLEQLELEAECLPGSGFEPLLADFLHCCPVVRDLRIKLIKKHGMPWVESSIDDNDRVQFDKSVSGFRNRRRTSRPLSSMGGENDDNYQACGAIPGLTSEQPFSCLQTHLRRVSLRFCMDEPSCLGVQLAKFFAENAMVLQELHIDDGCQEMLEHVNSTARRWIANADKTAITN